MKTAITIWVLALVVGYGAITYMDSSLDPRPHAQAGIFFAEGDTGAVYEDGSYIINTINGDRISGCLEKGICNDTKKK